MEASKKRDLAIQADRIRLGILEGTHAAASGHPGGSLSIADILSYLYFSEMRIDPANPAWAERDRFVLSKGHAARRWLCGDISRCRSWQTCAGLIPSCRGTRI